MERERAARLRKRRLRLMNAARESQCCSPDSVRSSKSEQQQWSSRVAALSNCEERQLSCASKQSRCGAALLSSRQQRLRKRVPQLSCARLLLMI